MTMPRSGSIRLSVPLTFLAESATLHCPMVDVSIRGVLTKLIVDTGATDHILTRAAALSAGLALTEADAGTDVSGASVSTSHIGDLELSLVEQAWPLEGVLAIAGPSAFTSWGVGGFLSPQRLAPDATVVVDLEHNRLLVTDGAIDPVATGYGLTSASSCVTSVTRHRAGTLGVSAAVEPFAPVVALLDSGAATTEFASDAVGSPELPISDAGRGVSDNVIVAGSLLHRIVRVGEARRRVAHVSVRPEIPAPVEAPPGESPRALLGMDLMKGTRLLIGPQHEAASWWVVPRD